MLLIHFLTACSPKPAVLSDTGVELVDTADTAEDSDSGEWLPEPCALDEGGRLPVGVEGDFLPQGSTLEASRARCEASWHAIAGARDSRVSVQLVEWTGEGEVRVEVRDLLGEVLVELPAATAGEALEFTLARTGEHLLVVEPVDPDADDNDYSLAVECVAGCERLYTRHPIVLMHGMGGTDSFVGLFNYFIGVKDHLEDLGYAVYTPAVDAFSPPAQRAAQWAVHLDELTAAGVGRAYNLIGHSQGGIDARYLASVLGYGPSIRSITTLATPHRGTSVAALLGGTLDISTIGRWVVDGALELFTDLFGLGEADFTDSILSLTVEDMADFNAVVPDVEGVDYYSWTGRTCGLLDFGCQGETGGEIVDLHFVATHTVIELFEGPNDGLVPVSSAEWGEVRGEMPADHLNQIGFFSTTTPFEHMPFFEDEAAHLAQQGY